MRKKAAIWTVALALTVTGWFAAPLGERHRPQPLPYARACRHDRAATAEDRERRAQAVALAKAINAAQAALAQRTGEYHAFAQLGRLPAAPKGFEVSLYADRNGYVFSLKDTTDPCHFAVFSDARGLIYEQSALPAPVVAQ